MRWCVDVCKNAQSDWPYILHGQFTNFNSNQMISKYFQPSMNIILFW